MKKKKYDPNEFHLKRRQALKCIAGAGVSALAWKTPAALLVTNIVDSILRNAHAAPNGIPRNYVHISIPGGPPRWLFDLPLRPHGNDPFIANTALGTRFADTGGSVLTDNGTTNNIILEHAMFRTASGLHMPYMWSQDLPSSSGGTRPMTDLLSNMLIVRGCRMSDDGHESNRMKQIQPIPGGPSLSGLVADYSNKPIPSISMAMDAGSKASTSAFKAPYGATNLLVGGSRPLEGSMLAAFSPITGSFRNVPPVGGRTLSSVIDAALDVLKVSTENDNSGDYTLSRSRSNAETLFRNGVSGLAAEYDRLYAKYLDLINRAVRNTNIVGITNRQIQGNANSIRFNYANDGTRITNSDIRSIYNNATNINLARHMAVAEYSLVSGLCSSVVIDAGVVQASGVTVANGSPGGMATDNDPHFSAMVMLTIGHTLFYRALAACLIEFISVLRNTSHPNGTLFDETVIHVAGDFGSKPRSDLGGYDHGWEANSVSIYSGIIQGPLVTGNIYQQHHIAPARDHYPGTWGVGAPVAELDDRVIGIGNIASTIAMLLRVETPTPNDRSLITMSGNSVSLLSLAAENTANT